jgi:hypothetical protein
MIPSKNIHLIKTDKPSRLFIDVDDNKLKICVPLGGEHMMNQNIYITNESDIKENDYVIVSCSEVNIEEVRIVTGYYNEQFLFDDKSQIHMDYCKKIILTTNEELIKNGVQSIDDDFLKWFVNNPSCEYVEIESNYRVKSGTIEEHKQGVAGYEYYEYKIILSQEEPKHETNMNNMIMKQETLEEAAEDYAVQYLIEDKEEIDSVNRKQAFKDGAKWQEKRMYSEEEVKQII